MTNVDDVLNIVNEQHKLLNQHMELVANAAEEQRKAYFTSLRRLLEAHEAAENVYVEGGDSLAGHAHRWVDKLDEVSASSNADFAERFKTFQDDLVKHTEVEIKNTMPKVLAAMNPAQLDHVFDAFDRVSRKAEPVGE
jgi:hypothetical protein